jgi:hypothetical protein
MTSNAAMVGKGQGAPTGNYGSGGDLFQGAQSVLVKQEIAVLESVCGIEAKNRYRVLINGAPQLYCMESSECCERICLSPCRALTMNIHIGQDQRCPVGLSLEKKFHCPQAPCILCPLSCGFSLPCQIGAFQCPADVTVKDNGQVIGTVFDPPGPAFWCKIDLIIRDPSGNELFTCGPKTLCSVGQICPCIAGEYIPVKQGGKEVAAIERKALDLVECCCKVNRFEVQFNEITDPTQRKLIFAAAFLLDLQYWEQQQK